MNDLLVVILLAVVVAVVDLRSTRGNMAVKWNGYGCIADVIDGRAQLPMQYRVLVPWLTSAFGGSVTTYVWLRATCILFAMAASYLWMTSLIGISLLALFFCLASLYDYTDIYIEAGLFALVFAWIQGSFEAGEIVIPFCAFVGALNRETSIFIPVAALMSGWWMIGAAALVTFGIGYVVPRLMYDNHGRYCEFNMVPRNLAMIYKTFSESKLWPYNEYMHFFLLSAIIVYCFAVSWPWTGIEAAMGLMFAALLVPSMWREIRVFAPVMLVVIPMGVKLL